MGSLVEFICPRCGKVLLWALENSEVQCNSCYRWIKFKDVKKPNPCKLDDKTEQLKMF